MTSAFRFNEWDIFHFNTSLRGNNKDGSENDFFPGKKSHPQTQKLEKHTIKIVPCESTAKEVSI